MYLLLILSGAIIFVCAASCVDQMNHILMASDPKIQPMKALNFDRLQIPIY